MSLKPSCLLYGPVFEDDPAMVFTFNAEHLVGHALRGQVKCMERILNNGTAAVVTMYHCGGRLPHQRS